MRHVEMLNGSIIRIVDSREDFAMVRARHSKRHVCVSVAGNRRILDARKCESQCGASNTAAYQPPGGVQPIRLVVGQSRTSVR